VSDVSFRFNPLVQPAAPVIVGQLDLLVHLEAMVPMDFPGQMGNLVSQAIRHRLSPSIRPLTTRHNVRARLIRAHKDQVAPRDHLAQQAPTDNLVLTASQAIKAKEDLLDLWVKQANLDRKDQQAQLATLHQLPDHLARKDRLVVQVHKVRLEILEDQEKMDSPADLASPVTLVPKAALATTAKVANPASPETLERLDLVPSARQLVWHQAIKEAEKRFTKDCSVNDLILIVVALKLLNARLSISSPT